MSTLYNHAFCFAFSIDTTDPIGDRIPIGVLRAALIERLASISDPELVENLGAPFDTYEHGVSTEEVAP